MKKLILIAMLFSLVSCAATKRAGTPKLIDNQTFLLTKVSNDATYGYTQENPVMVGGVKDGDGPLNERRYLNALAGPNGEKVGYFRRGSCCPVKSEHGIFGTGMLDIYMVWWTGSADTLSLYINMYDYKPLKAPKGFTIVE